MNMVQQDTKIQSIAHTNIVHIQERDLNCIKKVFLPINKRKFHPTDYQLLNELITTFEKDDSKNIPKTRIFLQAD